MSADPQALAAALASSGDPAADTAMLPPDQQGLGSVIGGYLKGLVWNPLKVAYELARRYGDNAVAAVSGQPGADPFLPVHDAAHAASGLDASLSDTFGHGSEHFWDTAASTAQGIAQDAARGPEQAGEALSRYVGPEAFASALGTLGSPHAQQIWGGAKAATHSPEAAATAQAMKAAGKSDREIWDATGMWNTPETFGQAQPWHWIDDSKASVLPDAADKVRAGGATLRDVIHPDWDAFKAYPGLSNLRLHYDDTLPPGVTGYYEPSAGSMTIGPEGLPAHSLRKTIVHEVSHAVQHFEGMPAGNNLGNPGRHEFGLSQLALGAEPLSPGEASAVNDLAHNFHESTAYGPSMEPYRSGYFNSAGEVAARTAEAMLEPQHQGARPFEMAPVVQAVDPPHQLVIGQDGRLFHPGLKNSHRLGAYHLTGQFSAPGPDLARGLQQLPKP